MEKSRLQKEIEDAINKCSAENRSNTPDFILAKYLTDCLSAFDNAVDARTKWYNNKELTMPTNPSNDNNE